jgi:hypothetical protein
VELLLFSLALLAGTSVLLAGSALRARRVAAVCLAMAACGVWLRSPAGDAALEAGVPAPLGEGGFVGSARCRACHPAEYDAWHRSFHRTMTQAASPANVLGSFAGVTLEDQGERTRLSRRGDEFWVAMPDPLWLLDDAPEKPRAPQTIEARVVMTTGSHHQQKYWVRRPSDGSGYRGLPDNGALVHVPWVWLVSERRWIPSRDAFLTPPARELPAVWNTGCFACHSVATQPRFDAEQVAFDTRSAELGVACEACHGPGAEHVAANASPLRRYRAHLAGGDAGDPTIVNAARLDRERSAEVCGQCHSYFRARDLEALQRTGVAYRAGGDLDATRVVFRGAHDPADPILAEELAADPGAVDGNFWRDGTIRVTGREYNGLLESACFRRGEMTCTSCHSMHSYAEPADQLAPARAGDASCLECHPGLRERVEAHTHHEFASSGSRCMNCHMPHTTYGLFACQRSHRVDSPRLAVSVESGRPNACNLCHLDRTLEWTGRHLGDWYGQPEVPLGARQRSVAAGVLWAVEGDAAQRAVVAWHMGWEPARQASGRTWMGVYLALLLADSYTAVRRIAGRSIETLPGFGDFAYDFAAPEAAPGKQREAVARWSRLVAGGPDRSGPHLLLDAGGEPDRAGLARLLADRDERPIRIAE